MRGMRCWILSDVTGLIEIRTARSFCALPVQSSALRTDRMKLLTEYLADAVKFERLARSEQNPALKAQLEKQAAAYRKLAPERAEKLGMPLPPDPPEAA